MKHINFLALFLAVISFPNRSLSQSAINNDLENVMLNLGKVTNNNEDFKGYSQLNEILDGVEILMLGEQSHGEATAYETKIKLIKYLHEAMGYDILAFESGFYDCQKAWQGIEKGADVRTAFGQSIFTIWSATDNLKPLAEYIHEQNQAGTPLKILGFDGQITGKVSEKYLTQDLSNFLSTVDDKITLTNEWLRLESNINLAASYKYKILKKIDTSPDIEYIDKLIKEIEKSDVKSDADFWIQTLMNIQTVLSDASLKTDKRDQQMAENLIWLKEKNPDAKIICWGATSHFLYNSDQIRMKSKVIQVLAGNYYKKHEMMGDYVKRHFKEKVFTIGFTAHEGEYGLWRRKKLKSPKKKSLEKLMGQYEYDNFLLPLKGLDLEGYISRPLGNFYMKNEIGKVMDAVIFNRYMEHPTLDNNFFLSIHPENKYIKPDVVNEDEKKDKSKA